MESNHKLETISSKQVFNNLRQNGNKIYTQQGLIFCFADNSKTMYSWTISKYVGNAVLRNKLKRLCRESVKKNIEHLQDLNLYINIIFPAKKSKMFQSLRFVDIDTAVKEFIKKYKHKNR